MSIFVVFTFFLFINYKTSKVITLGTFSGSVIDKNTGQPISTTIFIKNKGQVWLADSDETGYFSIQLPTQKAYTCEISSSPYQFYLKPIYHQDTTEISVLLSKK